MKFKRIATLAGKVHASSAARISFALRNNSSNSGQMAENATDLDHKADETKESLENQIIFDDRISFLILGLGLTYGLYSAYDYFILDPQREERIDEYKELYLDSVRDARPSNEQNSEMVEEQEKMSSLKM